MKLYISITLIVLTGSLAAQVQMVLPEYGTYGLQADAQSAQVIPYNPAQPLVDGCTYPEADNYNPAATQDDGSCVFGMSFCGPNTFWDAEAGQCVGTDSCLGDFDGDGLFTTTDLLGMLSSFGTFCP